VFLEEDQHYRMLPHLGWAHSSSIPCCHGQPLWNIYRGLWFAVIL